MLLIRPQAAGLPLDSPRLWAALEAAARPPRPSPPGASAEVKAPAGSVPGDSGGGLSPFDAASPPRDALPTAADAATGAGAEQPPRRRVHCVFDSAAFVATDGGSDAGADLELAYGPSDPDLRRALLCACDIAHAAGAALFDPQLGRELTASTVEDAARSFRRVEAFSLDVLGAAAASGSGLQSPAIPTLSPAARAALLLAAGAVLLVWLLGVVRDFAQELLSP